MFRGLIGFAIGLGAGWEVSKLHLLGQIDGMETACYLVMLFAVVTGVLLYLEPKSESGEWK